AGARLVGGCCGTTPEHVAAMRQALDEPGLFEERPLPRVQIVQRERETVLATDKPTQLATYLAERKFVVTVEMSPPKGIATHKLLAGARMLQEAGANFIDVADSPLARMRMSAWAAAYLLQKEVGIETVLHFPTRGRNLLRVQGDLLAAHALKIRNLFVTMGDPTRIGDYPEAMDSYDIVPTGLIQLIKEQFNSGLDKAGEAIDQPTNFLVGCALSLTPNDVEREMRLLNKKIRNGADFALTQPVFNPAEAKAFVKRYEETYEERMIPIIAGIKPLYNSRNTEFLHHEVPGIVIPDLYRERMRAAEVPQQEGVKIAQEILMEMKEDVHGVYLMPSFGRYNLVADVLDILR
ncbi:MAG TPA: methylenetetrahydrofolate reductase, partial [Anaerolineae bacterium]|nr:methylenetetrahydrofolate reductase [Anaerolineae bacterium]